MFLSEESRKKPLSPVVLPDQYEPKGKTLSPFICSLWGKNPEISQKKSLEVSTPKNIEKTPSTQISKESFPSHSLPHSPEKVPSREDQISKVKQAMSKYEELNNSSSRTQSSGFFRNLRKFI